MDQRKWRWSIQWMNSSPRDQLQARVFEFWTAGRENCFCFDQDHPEFLLQEEGPFRGIFSYEEDRSLSWSTTTFEWLALMIPFSITLISPLSLFTTTMFRNSIRDGMRIFLSGTKIPSDDILESLYKLRIRESDSTRKCIRIVRHGLRWWRILSCIFPSDGPACSRMFAWRNAAVVPSNTALFVSTDSKYLFFFQRHSISPRLLTTAPVSIFFCLASKFLNRRFWSMLLLTIVFNFW